MSKQRCLDLRGDRLRVLWCQLPERARLAALQEYARLLVRAVQAQPSKQGEKKS
jgi:hypothetical protein